MSNLKHKIEDLYKKIVHDNHNGKTLPPYYLFELPTTSTAMADLLVFKFREKHWCSAVFLNFNNVLFEKLVHAKNHCFTPVDGVHPIDHVGEFRLPNSKHLMYFAFHTWHAYTMREFPNYVQPSLDSVVSTARQYLAKRHVLENYDGGVELGAGSSVSGSRKKSSRRRGFAREEQSKGL